MLAVVLDSKQARVGATLGITFQRTLRIPDDGRVYPLPPGLGRFPIHASSEYASTLPAEWAGPASFFIPMYQREALWLGFDAPPWRPSALQIGVGDVNAVSGESGPAELRDDPQNYVVPPEQLWLDGINVGAGLIRQFVAMPLGSERTIEVQVTGAEKVGGLQIRVFEPKPGLFPDQAPPADDLPPQPMAAPAVGMGLGAGGRMRQKVYPDPYGILTWDQDSFTELSIRLLNAEQYRIVTGKPMPPTPITARSYTEAGLPWFELYDEGKGDVAADERLIAIKTISELDELEGSDRETNEDPVEISESQVRTINDDRSTR